MAGKPEGKSGDEKAEGKKGGKGLLIGGLVAVLLAAGGGGAWFMTRPKPDAEHAQPAKKVETVFMNLDPFTVNLADPGGDRLAQVGIVLELASKQDQEALAKLLPVVRNSLLLLISSQQAKTLLSLEGKLALADEIAVRTGVALGWTPEEPEEEEAEEPKGAKKVGNRKPKKRVRHDPVPNPVSAVHFSQMLIQ